MNYRIAGSHHPVDYNSNGPDIARQILDSALGAGNGDVAIDEFNDAPFPLAVIQKGYLSRLYELANGSTNYDALRENILAEARRALGLPEPGARLEERILEYCRRCNDAGRSPRETALSISSQFPDLGDMGLVTPVESGQSYEVKVPHGSYVSFDEAVGLWEIRQESLFS